VLILIQIRAVELAHEPEDSLCSICLLPQESDSYKFLGRVGR
jgi:hypothetical protein